MSFLTAQPEIVSAAAGNLDSIGAAMTASNEAASAPITAVIPAAADEVSLLTAARFAAHAQRYQMLSARAEVIHEMFVGTLAGTAGSYAAAEAANAALI